MLRFSAMAMVTGQISISPAGRFVVVDPLASPVGFPVTFRTVQNGSESCFSGVTVDKNHIGFNQLHPG